MINPWEIIGWMLLLLICVSILVEINPYFLVIISKFIPIKKGQRWKRINTKGTFRVTDVSDTSVYFELFSTYGKSTGAWVIKDWRNSGMYITSGNSF